MRIFNWINLTTLYSYQRDNFINKFVKKCQYYYTSLDQNVPLVTVRSIVSLLTKQPNPPYMAQISCQSTTYIKWLWLKHSKKDCSQTTFTRHTVHCRKEIGDFQIICSKVGGFRPFNYLLGVRCYLLSLKCKWLVLNKLCNFTAYKLFVSTNKQLTDPMDSMADPLFSSYSVGALISSFPNIPK